MRGSHHSFQQQKGVHCSIVHPPPPLPQVLTEHHHWGASLCSWGSPSSVLLPNCCIRDAQTGALQRFIISLLLGLTSSVGFTGLSETLSCSQKAVPGALGWRVPLLSQQSSLPLPGGSDPKSMKAEAARPSSGRDPDAQAVPSAG